MKPLLRLGVGLLLLTSAPARGDTVSLTNGRQLTGRVLSQSDTAVTLAVAGGKMDLPRSQIARIDLEPSLEDEYALRYLKIDAGDPEALDGLAAWCGAHRMPTQAQYLRDQAQGIRLDRRFARAKTAADFLEVADWAKEHGFSTEVRRLAASRALELAPRSARALDELARLDREDDEARRAADAETARKLEAREREVRARERAVELAEKALREKSDSPPSPPVRAEEPPPATEPPADDGGEPPQAGVILVRPHPGRPGENANQVVGPGPGGRVPMQPPQKASGSSGSSSGSRPGTTSSK
ncbi:MAG TPA: hypothetical protein VFF73_31105 [Planctomycetota bacterium]|nr:hypothetical protein [Planctomycetota bacterium]